MSDTEALKGRVAALLSAHRACCGTEHDPANGKLHGYCVVCGVPWPCAYAGTPPDPSPVPHAEGEGAGPSLPLQVIPADHHEALIVDAFGDDIARVWSPHEAEFLVSAINSHADLQAERDEARQAEQEAEFRCFKAEKSAEQIQALLGRYVARAETAEALTAELVKALQESACVVCLRMFYESNNRCSHCVRQRAALASVSGQSS